MLVLKGIKRNKLILYVSIIISMVVGTSFFIYKNYTLTSTNGILVIDASLEITDTDLIKTEDEKVEKDSSLPLEVRTPTKEIIGLSLLDNPKFKNLKENYIKTGDYDIGKRNPFEPY